MSAPILTFDCGCALWAAEDPIDAIVHPFVTIRLCASDAGKLGTSPDRIVGEVDELKERIGGLARLLEEAHADGTTLPFPLTCTEVATRLRTIQKVGGGR